MILLEEWNKMPTKTVWMYWNCVNECANTVEVLRHRCLRILIIEPYTSAKCYHTRQQNKEKKKEKDTHRKRILWSSRLYLKIFRWGRARKREWASIKPKPYDILSVADVTTARVVWLEFSQAFAVQKKHWIGFEVAFPISISITI